MKVSELIQCLKFMPQDAEVVHCWDGAARTKIEFVWEAHNGNVVTADYDQVVYHVEDHPFFLDTKEGEFFFHTPEREELDEG